jgi:predicted secreted hydrolase
MSTTIFISLVKVFLAGLLTGASRVCMAFVAITAFASTSAGFAQTGSGQAVLPDGFALPRPGREFRFPQDHGSHPEFKIEWWYVTGHLSSTNGERFGFQATFFRRSGPLEKSAVTNPAPFFGQDKLHLAHMALLEVGTGKFIYEERLNRRGWDADSETGALNVRNGNWSLRQLGTEVRPSSSASISRRQSAEPMLLVGGIRAEASWRMVLTPSKPLVIFGTNGISRKAAEPEAASHYLTFTRLQVSADLKLGTKTLSATGEAWMDHEISSSQLGDSQAGWDWTCIQFHDGREVMAYRMRRKDGGTDPYSTLAWIGKDGSVRHFAPDNFRWKTGRTWRSPRTKAEYPASVQLTFPDEQGAGNRVVRIEPLAADQELSGGIGGIPYWEGACRVLDEDGKEIGRAFLEMTGYGGGGWKGAL